MRRGDLFIHGKEGSGGKGSAALEECCQLRIEGGLHGPGAGRLFKRLKGCMSLVGGLLQVITTSFLCKEMETQNRKKKIFSRSREAQNGKIIYSCVWWLVLVIPALLRLRQEIKSSNP